MKTIAAETNEPPNLLAIIPYIMVHFGFVKHEAKKTKTNIKEAEKTSKEGKEQNNG